MEPICKHRPCCRDAAFDRADRGLPLYFTNYSMSSRGGAPDAKRKVHGVMARSCAPICIVLFALCPLGCTEAEIRAGNALPGALPDGPGLSGPTATAARKQNWDCRRIESAISNLVESMRSAKTRAEKDEEQTPQTLAHLVARLSGPPGAGNAALAEFTELRSDADQLNDLLKERRCAKHKIDVEAPTFLQP